MLASCSFSRPSAGYSPGSVLSVNFGIPDFSDCKVLCCHSLRCRSVAYLTPHPKNISSSECWLLDRPYQRNYYRAEEFGAIPAAAHAPATMNSRQQRTQILPSVKEKPYQLAGKCETYPGDCQRSLLSCRALGWDSALRRLVAQQNTGSTSDLLVATVASQFPLAYRTGSSFDAPTAVTENNDALLALPGQALLVSETWRNRLAREQSAADDSTLWVRVQSHGWLASRAPFPRDDGESRDPPRSAPVLEVTKLLSSQWEQKLSSFCINPETPHHPAQRIQPLSWTKSAQFCSNWALSDLHDHPNQYGQHFARRGGSRLCAFDEMLAAGQGGDSLATVFVWTATPCGPGAHIAVRQSPHASKQNFQSVCVGDDDGMPRNSPVDHVHGPPTVYGGRCCGDAFPTLPALEQISRSDAMEYPHFVKPRLPTRANSSSIHSEISTMYFERVNISAGNLQSPENTATQEDSSRISTPCTHNNPCGLHECLATCASEVLDGRFDAPPAATRTLSTRADDDSDDQDAAPLFVERESNNRYGTLLPQLCAVGWRVHALYAGNSKWYAARIAEINVDTQQVIVDWDDGDQLFRNVPVINGAAAVRNCSPPSAAALADSDVVQMTDRSPNPASNSPFPCSFALVDELGGCQLFSPHLGPRLPEVGGALYQLRSSLAGDILTPQTSMFGYESAGHASSNATSLADVQVR